MNCQPCQDCQGVLPLGEKCFFCYRLIYPVKVNKADNPRLKDFFTLTTFVCETVVSITVGRGGNPFAALLRNKEYGELK